jgi:hypothetical protein
MAVRIVRDDNFYHNADRLPASGTDFYGNADRLPASG